MISANKWHYRIRVFLLFLLCTAVSFSVRTCSYNREAASLAVITGETAPLWHGTFRGNRPASAGFQDMLPLPRPNFVPYTVESAMMFAYASDVALGDGVPEEDARLAYLPEIPPYAQMNMTLEWVLGWGYRFLALFRAPPEPEKHSLEYQDSPDFAWFVSVNVRLWTSLLSGLVFLWLVVLRVPLKYAVLGGLLHAVSAAAVARATGQDIVRGDFCIPLIIFAMILAHSLFLRTGRFRLLLLFLVTGIAFAAWDLCQMMFGIWILFELLRYISGGIFTKKRKKVWIMIAAAIILNALLIPFNVTYGLIMSKLVCVLLPLLFLAMYIPFRSFRKRFLLLVAASACLLIFYHFAIDNPEYRANYSHFSSVMSGKIKHLNVKPMDPAKLDYDARIMWTPSMHSCTWKISSGYFPTLGSIPELRMRQGLRSVRNIWNYYPLTLGTFFLLLLLGGLITPVRREILRDKPRNLLPYLYTAGFVGGFIFVVRYHEFLILFLSVAFPLLLQEWNRGMGTSGSKMKKVPVILFVILLVFEFFISTSARMREYGTVDSYLPQTVQLVRWFRDGNSMKGKTVAASFTLSPVLMAYTGANIVMQPQFGMEPIRRPVEEYIKIMYHGSLNDIEQYCERYNVQYFVYDRGMTGEMHPFSSRYIAAATEIKPDSPVNIMERLPDSMRRFIPVKPPVKYRDVAWKYRVFQFVREEDLNFAKQCFEKAGDLIRQDQLESAEQLIVSGLQRDPGSEKLNQLYEMLSRQNWKPALVP